MKRTIAFAVAILLLTAGSAFAELHGAWIANVDEAKPGRVHISMVREGNHFGQPMNISAFAGLTEAQVNATTQTPVRFQLVRDAGTVSFEGTFKNGDGAGQFSFAPNRNYFDAIRALNVENDLHRDSEEENLFTLAVLDVTADYIRSMQAAGYRETLKKYLDMRIFNVTPEYVRDLRAAGYDNLSAKQLVDFRIFKVTPEFIRDLRAAGYDNLTSKELVDMRIFKVTPDFIRELKDAGYSNIPVRKLIDMKIHKIDAKFIQQMNDVK